MSEQKDEPKKYYEYYLGEFRFYFHLLIEEIIMIKIPKISNKLSLILGYYYAKLRGNLHEC